MISNSRVSASGLGAYHFKEDGQEAPGHWLGKGAKSLQLKGEVKKGDLVKVAHGKAPNGIRIKAKRSKLVGDEYKSAHRAGTDSVFSPPKSASIIGLVGGDKRVIEAHRHATEKTLEKVEQYCAIAKVRTGGERRNEFTGNLIIAAFDHTTTRPDSEGIAHPQVHTHAVIFNSTKCQDGKWRSLENWKFFSKDKKRLRRYYIKQLGERLKDINYKITYEREGLHFSIKGITREQELAYSRRTKQMEEELGQPLDTASYKARQYATLKSRNSKDMIQHDQLEEKWKEIAQREGIDFDLIDGFVRTPEQIDIGLKTKLELGVITIVSAAKYKSLSTFNDLVKKPIQRVIDRGRKAYEQNYGTLTRSDMDAVTNADALEFIRPQHLSKDDWYELVVGSRIAPQIATESFETVGGRDAIELVLGPKLEQLGGHAQQYATKPVQQLLENYEHLESGGMWCAGTDEWGQLKPKTQRLREGKEVKYESPPGVPLGVMLPKSNDWDWDDIRNDVSVPLGVTEGGKKAASTSSQGLLTIGLAGMNGGLLQGDLRDKLKKFKWKGRKVYLALDKDPSHKLKTLRDGARELYKLGAVLDYYGADVVIGTIPGKLTEKVGLDDHFVNGRTLADLKWQSLDDFAVESKYLTKKYREHNQKRLALGLKADGIPKDDASGFDGPEGSTKPKGSSSSSGSSDGGSSDNEDKPKPLMPEVALQHVEVKPDLTKPVKAKPNKPVKDKDKAQKARAKSKQSRRKRSRSDRDEGLEI